MNLVKRDKAVLEKRHQEWIKDLLACDKHLKNIDSIIMQLQDSIDDTEFQRELRQLRNRIVMQKNIVVALTCELRQLMEKFSAKGGKKDITLSDTVANNRIRDKIRGAEQSVFLLRYQVSKLLSLAL